MKDKVLIRVGVPLADKANDFRVPYDLPCATVGHIIAEMLQSANRNGLPIHDPPVLWHAKTQTMLDGNKTLRQIGVTDSDLIIII